MTDQIDLEESLLTTSQWFKLSKRNKPFLSQKMERYAQVAIEKHFEKGEWAIKVGDIPSGVYYIESGIMELLIRGCNGGEKVLVFADQYYFLGDEILFHGQPAQYNAIAKTKVKAYWFEKNVFLNILETDFEIAYDVMYDMAVRVRVLANQIEDVLFHSIFEKVVKVLFCYSTMQENPNFKISQQDLAAVIGVHRVSLGNVISELRFKGIIETEYGKIIIKNPEALKKLAIHS